MADFDPHWAFPDSNSQFEFTDGYEMMHKAWSSIWGVPYCFSRSSVKFQGHKGQKMADFDPNWAFPDSNKSGTKPNLVAKILATKFGNHLWIGYRYQNW